MPTSVINEILSFCPQGTIASGDIMALEDYKNDVQRLRGHQPGSARLELENMAVRQSSFVAAGLAQFVAKRYAPGVRDDADLDALETAITAAITALIAASNAQTATRLATKRTIGGVAFDGSANIHHYATCSTAAATAAKTVALAGFALATGARVLVKFTVTNSAANPTLDVNGTGAKPIQYRGAAIAAGTLAANRTYEFVYTGAQYELVGDVDTNTTYPLATASNDGLMAKGDKGKLDGIAVGAKNVGQDFTEDYFMWCRPSAFNYYSYFVVASVGAGLVVQFYYDGSEFAGLSSGSNNYAPSNPALAERVEADIASFLEKNPGVSREDIPTELMTPSGSGLDPHISPASADVQVPRIVEAFGLSDEQVRQIIADNTQDKTLGVFGEETVNVLGVNLDIALAMGLVSEVNH